jgi:hypothetical protein
VKKFLFCWMKSETWRNLGLTIYGQIHIFCHYQEGIAGLRSPSSNKETMEEEEEKKERGWYRES